MVPDANPTGAVPAAPDGAIGDGNQDVLRQYAAALADGVEAALPGWVVRSVDRLITAWQGRMSEAVAEEAAVAGRTARQEIGPRLRALLATDVDVQSTGPLAVVREAARYPTDVLRRAGVPPVVRDAFAERTFPQDVYDLAPASFADLDPSLHEPGVRWGAAKAFVVLARRRAEGRR